MARQSASTSKKNSNKRPVSSSNKQAKRKVAQAPVEQTRLFNEQMRRYIAGVVLVVIAVVLFVMAILPSDAVVTSFLGTWLLLCFGVGAYILPFILLIIGITFFVHIETGRMTLRMTIGLLIIFVAVLGLVALFTPEGLGSLTVRLFSYHALTTGGGYLGAGIAWVCLTLLGTVISCVILIGLIVVGLVVIAFSLTGVIERIREARARRIAEEEEALDVQAAPPYARVRRNNSAGTNNYGGVMPIIPTMDENFDAAQTSVLSANSTRQNQAQNRRSRSRSTSSQEFAQGSTQVIPPSSSRSQTTRNSQPIRSSQSVRNSQPIVDQSTQTLTRKLGHSNSQANAPAASYNSYGNDAAQTGRDAAIGAGSAVATAAAAAALGNAATAGGSSTTSSSAAELAAPSPADDFVLPPMSLLKTSRNSKKDQSSEAELQDTAACLQETLEDFGIMADVVGWVAGPTVTLFKVNLPAGVRVSRITALEDDIALALAAPGVRIFAPIPGTNYVGIEVPNRTRQNVLLGDVLKDAPAGPLQIAVGKDVEGHSIISDLAQMPHLLIGGTTGSGKSVAINGMIMSILMRATPAEVRFIMIDPKRVEFSLYNGIPHLYVPVVTEPREAASALSWGVAEMERRLKVFSKAGVRNIGQYNAMIKAAKAAEQQAGARNNQSGNAEKQGALKPQDAMNAQQARSSSMETSESEEIGNEMPYIVIVIDELSDLMMNVGKEVEFSISRIAQLARAAGIHLIVATQRPSTNVVTGLIKANITNRIAFNVASGIDSRVILDTPGAENLIGLGDLLFSKPEYAKPQRIQGCYVSEEEINAVVAMLKEQGEPEYHSEILQTNLITLGASQPDGSGGSSTSDDPLIWEAADIVVGSGFGSTSSIQRRLKVGYSRAGRIMDMLEEKGVVGPPNGSKPREVLVDAMELETLKAFEEQDVKESER